MDRLRSLRETIEALPVHSIDGYEWDCDICTYRPSAPGGNEDWETRDPNGRICDHRELVDRTALMEALAALEAGAGQEEAG